MHWTINGTISVLGGGELPRLTQAEANDLNDALLDAAIKILKGNTPVPTGEVDVTCAISNCTWRSLPECQHHLSNPDKAAAYLREVSDLKHLGDSEIFVAARKGLVTFVMGMHRIAANPSLGITELRLRYEMGLTVKAARAARRRVVRAVARGALPTPTQGTWDPDRLAHVLLC